MIKSHHISIFSTVTELNNHLVVNYMHWTASHQAVLGYISISVYRVEEELTAQLMCLALWIPNNTDTSCCLINFSWNTEALRPHQNTGVWCSLYPDSFQIHLKEIYNKTGFKTLLAIFFSSLFNFLQQKSARLSPVGSWIIQITE